MSDPTTDLVPLRRTLHRIPELGYQEHQTRKTVADYVGRYATCQTIAKTGFIADIGPPTASRTVLLRADMDALPIHEDTGLPYASTNGGHMHACGHDAHMASLAVAGRLLAETPPEDVRVRLLFQPAEEGGDGAQACIDDGALDGVDAAFGIHVWNELPLGTVALTPGGIMAGVVELGIRVIGHGGHGAMPHRTTDPVVAAAHLITALQTIASRATAPVDPVVVTIGSIHGGDAFNVIPGVVEMRGTCRGFSTQVIEDTEHQVRTISAGIAAATGTQIEIDWRVTPRPTVNDGVMADLAAIAATTRMRGFEHVLADYRTMAGEDFGEILAEVPGCFALVGSQNAARGLTESHHSPRFEIDEAALRLACDLHCAFVREFAESGAPRH
ncbi:M20 family metallopeptidase [Mycobacterium sp. SMC-4]|uniref:M20 metallopeptidase family protein n=1 Tax=Mycobacterium sp. SMC-4 TaxID=2857059 RepID=UPI0021B16E71|nr:M20 family metallopeptidase [Mycobacterium sp. SMC-4]UXA16767.1 amidohydrolase [Mycobacterium sp. SMC-4]